MALYDGFFDAVLDEETGKYDREYGPDDFTGYFANIIGSGVCIHNNPDSFKAEYEDGVLYLRPGYLFIQGHYLANQAGEGEANYKGYAITLPANMTGSMAVTAHLNLGQRLIEVETQPVAQSYQDALVLAIVTADAVQDTRHNTDICGVIDTAGGLSGKVEWAINYINTEIDSKLEDIGNDIAAQDARVDAKIEEVQDLVDKIAPPPVGSIKFSASQDVGEEWLRCDGRIISKDEYHELVNLLLHISAEDGTLPIDFSWSAIEMPSNGTWEAAASGNGKLIAVARLSGSINSNEAAYSANGIDWVATVLPEKQEWKSAAYGGGKFVAVGSGISAAYSTDGVLWAGTTLSVSENLQSIAYGNGRFVAVSDDSYAVYSEDGKKWEKAIIPGITSRFDKKIAYGNGKFVVIGCGVNNVYYSGNGIEWESATIPYGNAWTDIAFGAGKFVAVAKESKIGIYSFDGVSWGTIDLPFSTQYPMFISYGEVGFVILGRGSDRSAYSVDCINWTEIALPISATWNDVSYGCGVFVAISGNKNAVCSNLFSGARLPVLSLSGVPAYIKAKELKETET